MTKEELNQEAEEYYFDRLDPNAIDSISEIADADTEDFIVSAYLAGAEPREKRIEELEATCNKWFEHLKNREEELLNELNNQNAKYNKQIEELEEQNLKDCEAFIKTMKETKGHWKEEHNQLTKAKEIISNLLILIKDQHNSTEIEWRVKVKEQAEQFLKEIEK